MMWNDPAILLEWLSAGTSVWALSRLDCLECWDQNGELRMAIPSLNNSVFLQYSKYHIFPQALFEKGLQIIIMHLKIIRAAQLTSLLL